MASTRQVIDKGSIVRLKNGEDGVVVERALLEEGFHVFDVLLLDSGQTRRCNRLQLDLVDTLDAPVELTIDTENAPVIFSWVDIGTPASVPTPSTSSGRFASFTDESEINSLAESRLSKNTK